MRSGPRGPPRLKSLEVAHLGGDIAVEGTGVAGGSPGRDQVNRMEDEVHLIAIHQLGQLRGGFEEARGVPLALTFEKGHLQIGMLY